MRQCQIIENLAVEIARNRRDFFAGVYQVESLFTLDPACRSHLEKLLAHATPGIPDFPANLSGTELKNKLEELKQKVHCIINKELYQPTKALYDALRAQASY